MENKDFTILLVDDVPDNLQIMVDIFKEAGLDYRLFKAPNGEVAYRIAEKKLPDLIITDWEMPVLDGIELIKRLKANPKTSEIPVIMCTGIMTSSVNLKTAVEAGASDYIRKPVDKLELIARTHSMLELSISQQIIQQRNQELQAQNKEIARLFDETESLLLNILPKSIAEELRVTGRASSRSYEQASVLFTDFKNFTRIASNMSPIELVKNLDHCFRGFDNITRKYGLEKIKTIGDAYMVAGGIPEPNPKNPLDIVSAGLEMIAFIENWSAEQKAKGEESWEVRIGIHTGPLVAGVVGKDKFAFDIWGDTVNIASRMESSGEPGKLNVSGSTFEAVKDHFSCEYRGKLHAKNKGELDMYFVIGPKEQSTPNIT